MNFVKNTFKIGSRGLSIILGMLALLALAMPLIYGITGAYAEAEGGDAILGVFWWFIIFPYISLICLAGFDF
ncbi:MAG: hypothetical protein LBK60_01990 [Verrucomicrobiales bacterium]|jgi:hypothetical protein|nr:hypothetical protein [Verrucomicrobiales bacterium]